LAYGILRFPRALVGSNFNNDGTALYEAMAAIVAQVLGLIFPSTAVARRDHLCLLLWAAGIPEAGLVTMTLVFSSVGLPTQFVYSNCRLVP